MLLRFCVKIFLNIINVLYIKSCNDERSQDLSIYTMFGFYKLFYFFSLKIQTLFERRVFVCKVCDNCFWLQLMF